MILIPDPVLRTYSMNKKILHMTLESMRTTRHHLLAICTIVAHCPTLEADLAELRNIVANQLRITLVFSNQGLSADPMASFPYIGWRRRNSRPRGVDQSACDGWDTVLVAVSSRGQLVEPTRSGESISEHKNRQPMIDGLCRNSEVQCDLLAQI